MVNSYRTRDCIILVKGDSFAVAIDPSLATSGWRGGQGVQWASAPRDEPTVKASDGYYAGFALWGSDESSDQLTAMTRQFPTYQYLVLGAGGWLIATTSYERYTWASRNSGGPLVPIEYHASDRLLFSNRGFWTKEDEWTLSGDPRAPNAYYIAFLCQAPTDANNQHMTLQVSI